MTTVEAQEPQTALITIEQINAPKLFGDGEIDPIINYIREQVADVLDVVPDVETTKGRQAIKSAAYKIARSKTLLDDAGKTYAAELKAKVKNIDGNRRTLRETLDALRDEIRKPVDDYEAAEQKRADEIASRINKLISAGQLSGTSQEIAAVIDEVKATEITEEAFGDEQGNAAIQKDVAISNLERALEGAKKREAEAEELERLRREKEEREQEERLRAREQAAADQAAAQERARSEQAERDAREAQERAEREAQEARERAERAEREAEERIEAERKAREAADERKRKEDEARAADAEHRRKINEQAVRALSEWSNLDEESAKTVITLIAAGRIPNVKIEY